MKKTLAIIGCLDTKGAELAYLKALIEKQGLRTHVIDVGILGEPTFAPDTPRDECASAAGTSIEALVAKADRGIAVEAMCDGATSVVKHLHARDAIHGILAAGGSANTTVATAAMRALPLGFPKLVVSTLAAGNMAPYVGTKDIAFMYSVVDVAGINRISSLVLGNAAHAMVGMMTHEVPAVNDARPIVAATMFGVTTPCVTEARRILEEAGFEVLVFHATGSGGRTMEGLIREGLVDGVLDLTTTELADELVGGILGAGEDRLTAAAECGVPQVVSIGAVDMVNFGPRESVPERFRERKFYQHNSSVTLMRTTPEENAELGRRIAERVNRSSGPVEVILPLGGVSLIATPGGVFFDEAADGHCRAAIREHLRGDIAVRELDFDINDPAFARACAEALMARLS